jgi:hypothetical protein
MKKICVIFFLILLVKISYSQIYDDAFKLSKFLDGTKHFPSSKKDSVYTILNKYLSEDNTTPGSFRDSTKNPFIYKYFNTTGKYGDAFILKESTLGSATKKGLSSTSALDNLDVTTIADGFAKFIVKKTKKELNIAFFEKFQAELKKYPDLISVFPQTYSTLSTMGAEIYMYEIYIQSLRESFKNDLASLPSNLPSIMINHKMYFADHPEMKAQLIMAFYIAKSVQNSQHPGETIEDFDVSILDFDKNVKAAFQTLQLFSISLKSDNQTDYWVSYLEIKKLVKDEAFFKIYLGLVLQKAKNDSITFIINDKQVRLDSVMKLSYSNWKQYQPYIVNFASKAQALKTQLNGFQNIYNDSLVFEKYYSIASSSIDFLRQTIQIDKFPILVKDSLRIEEKTKPYFDLAKTMTNMYIDVKRSNYSSAIVNTNQIICSINTATTNTIFTDVAQKLLKYGSFMATIAQAKSSDDIEVAIEAIALPSGSARVKRESKFNVSLNAYCGFFAGQNTTDFSSTHDYSGGITAPIGIAASWGIKHNSLTAFVSIVDFGAFTTFRFTNDTATLAKIKWNDLISPGVFISWGIPKCPISINAGCQLTPLLASMNASTNSFEARMFRFTLGVCVDIPIWNLYTSFKK